MTAKVLLALEIMGLGMAGIFAAIIIIMGIVYLLQMLDKKKKN